MQEWVKVVVQPLGLAGFALFLVFGLIARAKRADERKGLSRAALAMAFVALAGGLCLAFLKERGQEAAKPAAPQVQSIQTNGSASPVFVGTGAVSFTANQNPTSNNAPAADSQSKTGNPHRGDSGAGALAQPASPTSDRGKKP
jgi:hypothetical protein